MSGGADTAAPADDWELLERDWTPWPAAQLKGVLRELKKTERHVGHLAEAAGALLLQDRDELTQSVLRMRAKPYTRRGLEEMAEQLDTVVKYLQMEAGLFVEVKRRLEAAQARADLVEIAEGGKSRTCSAFVNRTSPAIDG